MGWCSGRGLDVCSIVNEGDRGKLSAGTSHTLALKLPVMLPLPNDCTRSEGSDATVEAVSGGGSGASSVEGRERELPHPIIYPLNV